MRLLLKVKITVISGEKSPQTVHAWFFMSEHCLLPYHGILFPIASSIPNCSVSQLILKFPRVLCPVVFYHTQLLCVQLSSSIPKSFVSHCLLPNPNVLFLAVFFHYLCHPVFFHTLVCFVLLSSCHTC